MKRRKILLVVIGLMLAACSGLTPPKLPQTGIVATQPGTRPDTVIPPGAPAATGSPNAPVPTIIASPAGPLAQAGTTAAPQLKSVTPSLVPSSQNSQDLSARGQVQLDGAERFTWFPGGLVVATEGQISVLPLPGDKAAGNRLAPVNPPAAVTLTANQPALLTPSPDGLRLAYAAKEGGVHVLDLPSGQDLGSMGAITASVTGLAFSPDGHSLVAATYTGGLSWMDPASGATLQSLKLPYWLSGLSFSPEGSLLAGADLPNFTVHLLDAVSGQEIRSLAWTESASPALYGVYFSPDWKTLAWVARGTVQLMDVGNGMLGATLEHEDFVSAVAWSPENRLLATAAAATVDGSLSPAVILWDVQTGQMVKTFALPSPAVNLAFSPDGSRLATLNHDGLLQFWAVP